MVKILHGNDLVWKEKEEKVEKHLGESCCPLKRTLRGMEQITLNSKVADMLLFS